MKAIIPVAGLGTRMLPATKAIPKEMLPLVDKPLIQYIVNECVGNFSITRGSPRFFQHQFSQGWDLIVH